VGKGVGKGGATGTVIRVTKRMKAKLINMRALTKKQQQIDKPERERERALKRVKERERERVSE